MNTKLPEGLASRPPQEVIDELMTSYIRKLDELLTLHYPNCTLPNGLVGISVQTGSNTLCLRLEITPRAIPQNND